jgi:glycosyltransferase involved in cell wall biosynthesis
MSGHSAISSARDEATAPPADRSARAAQRRGRSIAVQQGRNEYPGVFDYLVEELGFERLQLRDRGGSIRGKLSLVWGLLRNLIELLRRVKGVGRPETIIATGHFAFGIKLLARLGLLRYGRLYCFAFFLHGPLSFRIYRLLARLDRADDHYIVFSEWDVELYAERLGIDRRRLHYLPYGDWGGAPPRAEGAVLPDLPAESYYFAGGYTNRDYPPLIEAFRAIAAPLIIVCSSLNREVSEAGLPANVRVLRDLPSEAFEAYVRDARACIIPLKHDTGASGQSVMLRLMRNGKIIIASDVGGIRGYVADGMSGFLVRDMARELPAVVARIECDPAAAARIGQAAHERYCRSFSRRAVSAALKQILAPPPA